MPREYPQFQLQLPGGGPLAHGRLLDEQGTKGSQSFQMLAGSPACADNVPSFSAREQVINEGVLVQSAEWPG